MPTLVSVDAEHEYSLLTAEEFLDWLQPDRRADLIDGEIALHSPVSLKHARLVRFLAELISAHCRRKKIGGEVLTDVVAVRLSSRNVFEPDLSWMDADQVAQVLETHTPFAPRWVCEVLSSRTADRDVGPKFAAYEEHGVDEYWILDPGPLRHRFYARQGEFLVEHSVDEEWIVSQAIPGFRVHRGWLNPEQMPDMDACLAQIA